MPADIDAAETLIARASVVILQLEIPLPTVKHAIATCQRLGVFTVLDPAPVPPKGLSRDFFGVDVFTPNQSEAELLLGMEPTHRVTRKKSTDPKQIGSELLTRGPVAVLLKLGKRGAMIVGRDGHIEPVPGFKVKVVDSTAAGDAFTGALAVAHSEGMDLTQAVHFANAAGALSCTGFGAQPSLPTREQVEAFIVAHRR
jgi:ribokinase